MNVEIGAEAVLFPEKEYKKGIFVAVSQLRNPSFKTVGGFNDERAQRPNSL